MVAVRFDGVTLDEAAMRLERDGRVVAVEPQVFEVLAYLVRHRDRLVPKTELLDEIWGDRFVSESALSSRVKSARQAIGDTGREQRLIRTVHGRGYQFVGDVEAAVPPPVAAPASEELQLPSQQVRFCTATDRTRLAWARSGTGPVLVKAANWLSHLEFDWESVVWRHWLRELTSRYDLVRHDARGSGLSDWDAPDLCLDRWVDDLEVVVDEAGLDRFPLLGISQGAAVAIEFAARHPERVTRLVLYGGYVQGPRRRARDDEGRRLAELRPELAELGWGSDDPAFRQVFTARFMPGAPKSLWDEFNELQRRSTSPQTAARFMRATADIDVAATAARLDVPTLVLHARRDRMPPLEQGRALAGAIRGSRFVTLESDNHLLLGHEPAWDRFVAEVTAFLSED